MKHARIANAVFNRPQMIEPQYARTFVSALARYLPDLNIQQISLPDGTRMDAAAMAAAVDGYSRSDRKPFQEINGIAVIPVEGTLTHRFGMLDPYSGMTGYDGIQTKLDAALDDDSINGILLDIDSPGGAVSGCFDLADAIFEARREKPVWGLVDELCASAAFALGSACNRLIAPRTAQIGSVGVLTMHADQSERLEQEGLAVTFVYAGDHKIDGNSFEPLSEDVRASIQGDIDSVYDLFVETVARNRGMDVKAVRNTEARVYSSKEAQRVGFIDQIMPARDVIGAFDADLRAGRAGQFTPSRSAEAMRILGLGRKAKQNTVKHEVDAATELSLKTNDSGQVIGVTDEDDQTEERATATTAAAEALGNAGFKVEATDLGRIQVHGFDEDAMENSEPLFTESEARAQFGAGANAASLDALVKLCGEHRCSELAQPLQARSVTAEQAATIMADVDTIRDKMTAALPDNPDTADRLATQFINAAYGEQQLGGAIASLMIEATARASGDEVDHHQPASANKSATAGHFNAVKFYQRKR